MTVDLEAIHKAWHRYATTGATHVISDIPAMLTEIRELRETVERLKAELAEAKKRKPCSCTFCCASMPDGVERGALHEQHCKR